MKKLFYQLTVLGFLIVLNGCAPYRHTIKHEIQTIENSTRSAHKDYLIQWGKEQKKREEELSSAGLSINDAISLSLIIDPGLKAQFEKLGISKTDLIQAGIPTNPRLDTIFQFPRTQCDKACIEVDLSFTLSDFWQIPLRKKIAQKELEIISQETSSMIIDLIMMAKQTYNRCMFEEAQLETTQKIYEHVKQLQHTIELRQLAGLASDYDIYFINTVVALWANKVTDQQLELQNAYLGLRNSIGVEVINKPLHIKQKLHDTTTNVKLPDGAKLVQFAKDHRPDVLMKRIKIQQAKNKRSLEKRKIIDNVTFGTAFTRGTDGSHLFGPSIGLDLPAFDWNQAQIERAQKEKNRAEQDLISVVALLEEDVLAIANKIKAQQDKIEIYQKEITPAIQQAIEFTKRYSSQMQLDTITFINTQIELYEQELKLNREYFELLQSLATLEKTIGGSIPY